MKTAFEYKDKSRTENTAELYALKESIRACAAESAEAGEKETFRRETEALLKMLEKPHQESEADRIIQELHTRTPEQSADRVPDVLSRPLKRRLRHPVITVMLFTFSVLLVSAAVLILSSGGGTDEPVPLDPASLCAVEDNEYMLGIEGETLAVYRNGVIERTLSYPVSQLSEYDRALLCAGIPLADERALRRAIEDYTS